MESKSKGLTVKDEKERRNKIRRRMWAAVRIHMMAMREGASMEALRMVQV